MSLFGSVWANEQSVLIPFHTRLSVGLSPSAWPDECHCAADADAIDLLSGILHYAPEKRLTPAEVNPSLPPPLPSVRFQPPSPCSRLLARRPSCGPFLSACGPDLIFSPCSASGVHLRASLPFPCLFRGRRRKQPTCKMIVRSWIGRVG